MSSRTGNEDDVQIPVCGRGNFIEKGLGARLRDVVTYDAVPAYGGYSCVEVAVELTEHSDGTGLASVFILAGDGVYLSSGEARQVAENLTAAADNADRVVQR
ncbi:hypothetical protein ABZU78_29350 [Rhodococcus erythropolis]|uniref:hypothetical protein n=1 Tax=Rhodococcus erythropolis TaxID=1833 RepID=UPI0033B54768